MMDQRLLQYSELLYQTHLKFALNIVRNSTSTLTGFGSQLHSQTAQNLSALHTTPNEHRLDRRSIPQFSRHNNTGYHLYPVSYTHLTLPTILLV